MKPDIEETVRRVLIESLALAADTKIESTTHIIDDLGADSIDIVETVMALEEEFGIQVPDDDLEGIANFDQMCDVIRRYVEAKCQTA